MAMAPGKGRMKQLLKREVELTWRYCFNLRPVLEHRRNPPRIGSESSRVAADLDRDGVAVTSIEALLGSDECLDELRAAVEQREELDAGIIERARAAALQPGRVGEKTYIHHLLGDPAPADPSSIYARLALNSQVRGVANAYYGMRTQVRGYNVLRNFAAEAAPRESQLWHRDEREDHLILKVFVYLSEVDEGAGPFVYAPGTHAKGRRSVSPPTFSEGSHERATDESMGKVLSPSAWTEVRGPIGTVVFADTTGWHRGGWARTSDRLVYNCLFGSQACKGYRSLRRPADLEVDDPDTAFALNLAP